MGSRAGHLSRRRLQPWRLSGGRHPEPQHWRLNLDRGHGLTRPQVREPRHVDRVPGFFFASSPRFPPAGDKHGPWIAPGPAPRSPDRVPQPRRISACPARIADRGPGRSGQLTRPVDRDRRAAARGPVGQQARARAMFLTNNPVKNDMDVSRETLPNY